uniref:Uncharacterized protein n=1 Tax=Rhodopseudomonas palustris (strain BisA53) TaxID=316055 RepID=Q07HU9_RHOP5
MLLWLLIAILLTGGAAAIVNDAAYDGGLFNSGMVVQVAMLSALTLWIGRGFLRDSKTTPWVQYALIWAAIVLAVMVLYQLLSSGTLSNW